MTLRDIVVWQDTTDAGPRWDAEVHEYRDGETLPRVLYGTGGHETEQAARHAAVAWAEAQRIAA